MRTLYISLILFCALWATADAQLLLPMKSAFFGTAGFTLGALDNDAFSQRLQSYRPAPASGGLQLVYQTQTFSNVATGFNMGLFRLFRGGYIAGASLEFLWFPTVHAITGPGAPADEYELATNGVGLDFGYAIFNQNAGFFYPIMHLGYYHYDLKFSNKQTTGISFYEDTPTLPGGTSSYSGAAPLIGIGAGFTSVVNPLSANPLNEGAQSGVTVNARLSLTRFLVTPEWERDGLPVKNGGHTPCHCGATLTVSVGGLLDTR